MCSYKILANRYFIIDILDTANAANVKYYSIMYIHAYIYIHLLYLNFVINEKYFV